MNHCCNQNCERGDECPLRQVRDLTKGQRVCYMVLGLLWAMAAVASMTGAKQ